MKKFNVLNFDMTSKTKIEYDVLPYFRDAQKEKRFEYDKVKTKEDLKNWIENVSQYQFWARCQYEFLMAPWPIGSYKVNNELKEFLKPDFDIKDYKQSIDFYNILMIDMYKIDIHEQIMMNIDIITDILSEEFEIFQKTTIKN